MKILAPADADGLACLAEAIVVHGMAAKAVAKHGALIATENRNARGGYMANPAIAVMNQAARDIRLWCQEFGLTPSARGRVVAPGGLDDKSAEELWQGGGARG